MNNTRSKDEKFWDKWAERYSKSKVSDQASYEKKLQITQSYFTPETKILELGCGTGSTAIHHAPYVKHIHAVDISSKMLDIAKSKTKSANIDNITYQQSEIDTFENKSICYDIVLTLSVLHLLKNKESVMLNIHQMLKPGGYFISSTPCIAEAMKLLKYIAPLGQAIGLMPGLDIFTKEQLLTSIKQSNFMIDQTWQPAKNKAVFIVAKKTN